MATTMTKFTVPARIFHWLVALLIAIQIPLAYYMIALPLSPEKLGNYALHKSIGCTIFSLAVLRLLWRWLNPPPPLPKDMTPLEQALARGTHWLLYGLIFAMPVAGWLNSSAANFPVSVFGLFTLPNLVDPDPTLQQRFELAHRIMAYSLFALLGLHIGAALLHHFVRRDNVLNAMLPLAKLR